MHPTNDGSKQNHDRIKSIGKYTYGTNNINIYYWGEGTYLEIGNFYYHPLVIHLTYLWPAMIL